MTDQEFLEHFSKHNEAQELTLQGITQFNEGNFAEALAVFEESLKTNPHSIPALLYHSLC